VCPDWPIEFRPARKLLRSKTGPTERPSAVIRRTHPAPGCLRHPRLLGLVCAAHEAFAREERWLEPFLPSGTFSSVKFSLVASDLVVGIWRRVQSAAVVQAGTVCVSGPGIKLNLDNPETHDVVLQASDDGLNIRSKQVEFGLPLEDVDSFPEIAEFEVTSYHIAQARDLKALIRRTGFAADVESTRCALGGTLVELTTESIAMVATDGRRLARRSVGQS
jgi:hypothetical protein